MNFFKKLLAVSPQHSALNFQNLFFQNLNADSSWLQAAPAWLPMLSHSSILY
jgi:hypothetical protein